MPAVVVIAKAAKVTSIAPPVAAVAQPNKARRMHAILTSFF